MSQQSGLKRAWDSWTSRPENNAALMNFGLSMMNPAPGNFLSNVGYGLGAAAEGMSANVKKQEERQQYEEGMALKEEEQARKERETDIYGQSVRQAGARAAAGGITPVKMWQARIKAQMDFDKQLDAPGTGMGDTMWEELSKQKYPGKFKNKFEYKNSPEYQRDREAYIKQHTSEQLAGMDLSGGTGLMPGGGGGEGALPPGARPTYDAATGAPTGYTLNGKFTRF
jgi:hypothetical protein